MNSLIAERLNRPRDSETKPTRLILKILTMRVFQKPRLICLAIAYAAACLAATSCIKDDQSDCTLELRLRYVYNMQGADGLAREANEADVYVFDSENKFVGHYTAQNISEENFTMHLPLPEPGRYTFVAWAKSTKETNPEANFEMTEPQKRDDSPKSLTARIRRNRGCAKSRLNNLLNGTLETEVSGANRKLTIDLMKCTNAIRIILMPSHPGQTLKREDFDISIEGKNGWLGYDASAYRTDKLIYYPYRQLLEQSSEGKSGDEIDNAVTADFNTSRILDGSNARLVVRNASSGREILNINLPWFLSLQAIGEHRAEWTNQEYLDRQDEYSMTFFIDGATWMETKIVVNGWVLSLQDIDFSK